VPRSLDDDPPGFDGDDPDQGFGDDFDEGLDPEGPSQADLERFGDEFITCPECGSRVYDQVPLCPECGHAFSNQPGGVPVWLVVTAVVVVFALLALVVF